MQRVDLLDPHAFIHLVDRRVHHTDLDHLRAHRRDEPPVGRAAAGRKLGRTAGDFFDGPHGRGGQRTGWRVERLAGQIPLECVADAMLAQDALDRVLQALQRLHWRIAQIESCLQFAGNDVRCTGAGIQVRDLESGRLEEFVALIPCAARQFGKRRCQHVHGILGELRVGHMPLHAVHRQAPGEGSTPTDLDRVTDLQFAGGLADDAPVHGLAPRFQRLDDALGAVDRRTLLVAGDQEGDRAAMLRRLAHELGRRRDHRCESALHVGGAAAIQHAVADDRLERIRLPFLERSRRHHVRMARETQDRTRLAAFRPEVLDAAVAQWFDRESGRGEALAHRGLAASVSRGDRISGDEVQGQVEGFGHGGSYRLRSGSEVRAL